VIILNKNKTPPVIKAVFRVHNNNYKKLKNQFKYKTIIPKKIQRDQITQSITKITHSLRAVKHR
jgi:hypothetical protein